MQPNETFLIEIGSRAYWYLFLENTGRKVRSR